MIKLKIFLFLILLIFGNSCSKESIQKAIIYSESLREKVSTLGIKINMGLEGAGSQFKKADKSGASYALILGDDELKDDTISVKDLRSKSEQETLSYADIEKRIKKTYK